jgi:hypothetical protein
MNRSLKIILIVLASVVAVGVAAGAIMAGVIESERTAANRKTASTAQPTAAASLQVVPPKGVPGTATVRPAPAPTSAPSLPVPEPTAYAPEIIETLHAPVPSQQAQRPAPVPPQTVCPTGVVESGLTDITVTNERYTTVAGVSTMVDIAGQGLIRNRTTTPVYIFDSAPSVRGLDTNGRLTIYLDTDFNWKPTPGEPRPAQITLQPGESLTYRVYRTGLYTSTLRETAAWYVNPEDAVDYYADFRTYVDCPDVSVVALPGGTSIMNTYVPWGQ